MIAVKTHGDAVYDGIRCSCVFGSSLGWKHKLQQPQETRAIRQANRSSSSSSSSHTIICVAPGSLALGNYRREGDEPRFLKYILKKKKKTKQRLTVASPP